MFNLYDVVRLRRERPDVGLEVGARGTVIDILGGGEAYTVEFFDNNNETIEKTIYTHFTENEIVLA